MINIGQVIQAFSSLMKVMHGTKKTRFIQVSFGSSGDVQDIQFMRQAGLDVNPYPGCAVAIIDSGPSGGLRIAVASDDFIPSTIAQGEAELYAQNGSGSKLGRVQCRQDGLIYIGTDLALGGSLRAALESLVQGIQGATVSGSPLVDTTGKIASALVKIQNILDASVS